MRVLSIWWCECDINGILNNIKGIIAYVFLSLRIALWYACECANFSNEINSLINMYFISIIYRDAVTLQYAQYVLNNPQLIADAKRELKGKVLACWCAPKKCM